MINSIEKQITVKMEQAIKALRKNLTKINTGRANPEMLDILKIKSYGDDNMKIDQLATVTTEGNRVLVINAWDKDVVPAIEKAIVKSNLGLNPSSAGTNIRIIIPPLTEETRLVYSKQAKGEAESAKVAIRNARRDGNGLAKKAQKNSEMSENDESSCQQIIQKLTDTYISQIDAIYASKHAALISI